MRRISRVFSCVDLGSIYDRMSYRKHYICTRGWNWKIWAQPRYLVDLIGRIHFAKVQCVRIRRGSQEERLL